MADAEIMVYRSFSGRLCSAFSLISGSAWSRSRIVKERVADSRATAPYGCELLNVFVFSVGPVRRKLRYELVTVPVLLVLGYRTSGTTDYVT